MSTKNNNEEIIQGDIILCPFPLSDKVAYKVRPALVISKKEIDDHIVIAFISSSLDKYSKSKFDLSVAPSVENRLKVQSTIRISKIASVNISLAFFRLGRLEKKTLKQVLLLIKKLF